MPDSSVSRTVANQKGGVMDEATQIPVERQDLFDTTITRTQDAMVQLWARGHGPLVLRPEQAERLGLELVRIGARAGA